MTLLSRDWEKVQIKVFSRWCAKHLSERHIEFNTVEKDFSDSTKLLNLLEIIGKEPVNGGKWHKAPKNRYQQLENCEMAINYITQVKKIKLIGIHPDDIVDHTLKLTLGLVWSCINKFQVEDISVEEQTARNALLQWCKKNTQGYERVNITNFTSSWSSGLGFAALINRFRPEVLDYNSLNKDDALGVCQAAFDACRTLGLFVYLDPEDVAGVTPDEKSVVTQVSEFFHFFAGESKVEAMADKLRRTVAIQRELDQLKSDYASQAQAALDAMAQSHNEITAQDYDGSLSSIKQKLIKVIDYTRADRQNIVDLRGTALKTWGQLVTKCKATSRPQPVPPQGLEPETLTTTLNELDDTATSRRQELSSELKAAQQQLVEEFDQECQALAQQCEQVKQSCTQLSGTVEQKQSQLESIAYQVQSELRGAVQNLQEPWDFLVSQKLNYRAQNSVTSISALVDQTEATVRHTRENLSALAEEEAQMAKVQYYNNLCEEKVQETKTLDHRVESVSGDNQSKRNQLLQIDSEVQQQQASVSELNAPYEELEREELQVHANFTPDSVANLFTGIQSHIQSLISAIDSAIAAEKGFEISEEQLAEFRETFKMFDNDKNNHLQYYELNACLTSLGDTATDDECKAMISKYTGGAAEMDFDSYVKFMLDRFSKSENKETTTEAFHAIAQNSPIITDEQLNKYFSPEDAEYLRTQLQSVDGGYDFASWVDSLYA